MLRPRVTKGGIGTRRIDVLPAAADSQTDGERRRKVASDSEGTAGNILFFILSFALTLFLVGLSYSSYTKKLTHAHIVKTKHLRKPVHHHKHDVESSKQDDLVPEDSIYTLNYPTINHEGGIFQLSRFAGRVALVVNVASKCDDTELIYSHIKTFLEKYSHKTEGDKGDNANREMSKQRNNNELVILAFPTNDFHQEPGTNEDIEVIVKELLGEQYDNPNFLLFHKSTLQHNPIYKSLRTYLPEHEVKNNFYKYLIGRDGVPVGHYTEKESLFHIESAIQDELESL
mmetsp:Transcript_1249/g.2267  ORF Transcript_1249/g.2267 Transcript_1249/m.2267 type:complete len:286 (-) Transcript_1249:2323-3180(-)